MNGLVDVIIPRGSGELIRMVVSNSSVPVIETGAGNCTVYIDKFADENMAIEITFNAKTQRISTCNTIDSLLIHRDVANQMLPAIC
jgi:glutamate-5-semialdehyde dehydrogenase